MKTALVTLVMVGGGTALLGETIPEELRRRFEYDRRQPLEVQQAVIRDEGGVSLRDVSYSSPAGGRVAAYLVTPAGGDRSRPSSSVTGAMAPAPSSWPRRWPTPGVGRCPFSSTTPGFAPTRTGGLSRRWSTASTTVGCTRRRWST